MKQKIFLLGYIVPDLKDRLGKIVVATRDRKPILAKDINAHGNDCTFEGCYEVNLCNFGNNRDIHRGPFANIAHIVSVTQRHS